MILDEVDARTRAVLERFGFDAETVERLYHHASWELETMFLEVPRSGARGRFFPIKEPEDRARVESDLRGMLDASVLE